MGKKAGKGGGGAKDFWDGVSGWKQVEVGDDLLLGADEFGFCGLEELDASAIGDFMIPGGASAASGDGEEPAAAEPPPAKKKKKKQLGQKRKEPEAAEEAEREQAAAGPAAAEEGGESLDKLKGQVAALQAENRQLKKRQKQEARAEKRAAAAAMRKQVKAAKRAAAAECAAAAAAAAAAARPLADTSAWRGLELHPAIEAALGRLGFEAPTHVQAECLPAAIRDRRDVIGAAQTGSGKTLAFGLPIMQRLLQDRQQAQQAQQQGEEQQQGDERPQAMSPLRALILAPTRELALQVCEHLQAVGKGCGIWVVPIVGGISALKQERLLAKHPEVVVATPGRLLDLMRAGHAHLTHLSRLSFLVIDEADRMVQQGHYGELSSILGAIPVHQQLAVPEAGEPDGEPEEEAEEEEGEAELGSEEEGEDSEGEGEGSQEEEEEEQEQEEQQEGEEDIDRAEQKQQEQLQRRQQQARLQTFVFSATLTLPASLRRRLRKGGGGASGSSDLDSLMDKIPFRGKPKIVDLTSQRRLADKVEEAYLACGEDERDEYLYCLLTKHPGRTIVFVNAISSVRRLGAILKLLGVKALPLHAGMQQRQRLRALDRFKADPTAVLVATDVAARGLDVKDVRCVIHYQLPASVDVYVHRSGRTARAEAEGVAVALVTPKENARFLALLRAMNRGEPPEFPLDTSLLPAVRRRVRLAVRLDALERRQSKDKAERSWRQQHAEQLGIELSEEESEGEDGGAGRRQGRKARRERGGKRGPEEADTAAEVRTELAALLAEPLQPQFSQKWFTGGAAAAVMAAVDPSAPAVGGKKGKKGKKPQGGGAEGGSGAAGACAGAGAGPSAGAGAAGKRRRGEEAREVAPAAAEPKTGQTVSQAVALAQQRSDSRVRAAVAAAAKQQAADARRQRQSKRAAAPAAPGPGKKAARRQQQDPQAAAVQAALAKALAAKHRKKAGGGRGMLVIPQALGREAAGPDALQALRQKLGA